MAGVVVKLVEERVEERDTQVYQRHDEGNEKSLCLLEQRPAGRIFSHHLDQDGSVQKKGPNYSVRTRYRLMIHADGKQLMTVS